MRRSVKAIANCAGGTVAAAVLLGTGIASAFDPEVLRVRLLPKEGPPGASAYRLEVTETYWKPEEAVEAEHRRNALRVTRDYVARNLSTWTEGGALEPVERLRHTDLSVRGASGAETDGLDVRLRVAEEVRLTVTGDAFRRDLMLDPLTHRMWMDLYRLELPHSGADLTLTNTYRLDDEGNRVLLKLRHSLE